MIDYPPVKIELAYEDAASKEKPRQYIGASIIGDPCDAMLVFSMRGFPDDPPAPHVKRIFHLGHKIEEIVIEDLRLAGFQVWDRDPLTGKQFEITDWGGHVAMHMDGQIEDDSGLLCLLEIKSMNDDNWKKFQKEGVKNSHKKYYAQMQFMMGYGGFRRSLFIAYNKNNSQYHSEYVDFDPFFYEAQMARLERILERPQDAERIGTDESDWRCRSCFKRSACWRNAPVERRCGTCGHSRPQRDTFAWWCAKHNKVADGACEDYVRYEPRPRTS